MMHYKKMILNNEDKNKCRYICNRIKILEEIWKFRKRYLIEEA